LLTTQFYREIIYEKERRKVVIQVTKQIMGIKGRNHSIKQMVELRTVVPPTHKTELAATDSTRKTSQ
jgi:hypothetical protein